MKIFIIDGNNLIGKHSFLSKVQKKDKQLSREKLASMLDSHFRTSKNKIFLHLDGFVKYPINTLKVKIIYSDAKTADDKIRKQIENTENPRNITLVSSDGSLTEFAKVCSCAVIKSEDFANELMKDEKDEEASRIESMNKNVEEFKRLFDAK